MSNLANQLLALAPSPHSSVANPGGAVRSRYKWWHEAIINDMIAFPLDDLKTRGARLGYSIAYLSTLINSDMFQLFYRQRKEQHSELLTTSLVEKTAAVAGKTLDLMLESLEQKRTAIPFGVLADTAQKSLASLGYGVKQAPAIVVNNTQQNVQVTPPVSREQLAAARDALLHAEAARVIEHQPRAEGAGANLLSCAGAGLLGPANESSVTETVEAVDAARLVSGNE